MIVKNNYLWSQCNIKYSFFSKRLFIVPLSAIFINEYLHANGILCIIIGNTIKK